MDNSSPNYLLSYIVRFLTFVRTPNGEDSGRMDISFDFLPLAVIVDFAILKNYLKHSVLK